MEYNFRGPVGPGMRQCHSRPASWRGNAAGEGMLLAGNTTGGRGAMLLAGRSKRPDPKATAHTQGELSADNDCEYVMTSSRLKHVSGETK